MLALLLFLLSSFLVFFTAKKWNSYKGSSLTPINWPVLGMLPGLLKNAHRVHDFATDILKENGGTFLFKGPWFANMDMLITSDPSNMNHVLSKNFHNYPKGHEFNEIFDVLGDGVFNSDSELWEVHRKVTKSLFNCSSFQMLLEKTVWFKIEKGLLPVLDFLSEQRKEIDLQDVFLRLGFDSICILFLDHDPGSLSIEFPYIPHEKGISEAEEALFYRHVLPRSVWKSLKLFQIGKEKQLSKAWKVFDEYLYMCISMNQEERTKNSTTKLADFKFLTSLMQEYKYKDTCTVVDPNKFLRDILLNLIVAGRDTTSVTLTWFFYLLAQNPSVDKKIKEEIHTKLHLKQGEKWRYFGIDELQKLVYLHGALCETLRLFPPVALNHKAPSKPDILPSGHPVDKNSRIILSFYSMGRMESIWGSDCMEFKPERWISEQGGTKHEPSFKFTAFNAGPRTCLGKEMAFTQMKIVATTIIYHYHVELIQGHPISPVDSVILQMKYGLKVKLTKRKDG